MFVTACSSAPTNEDSTTEGAQTEVDTNENEGLTAVRVSSIQNSDMAKNVTYSGKIEPSKSISVISKISGNVTNTYKEVGDNVTSGETLFTIDSSDIEMSIQQAQAQVDAANVAVKSAENAKNSITGAQYEQSLLSLESSIENLETSLTTANDALNFAKTTYDNAKILYDAGAMSKVEYDQAELSYNNANAQVTQLESQLNQAKQSYELTKNNLVAESTDSANLAIEQANAQVSTANIALQNAQKNLEYVAPTSPISGVISAKNVMTGQFTQTGTVAYTISNIDTVVATINVSENIINDLSVGDTVDLSISSIGETLQGTISEINPVANQTSTYPVKINISNPNHTIKPGMFCEVTIETDSSNNTISIPREALLNNMDTKYVYIVEDSKAIIREVETGLDNGQEIEITSGLNVGDQVIVEGQTYVSEGESVNIIQ